MNQITAKNELKLNFLNNNTIAQIIRIRDNAIVAQLPDHLANDLFSEFQAHKNSGMYDIEATFLTISSTFNYESLVEKEKTYGFAN